MTETLKTFTALREEFVELFMKHHPVEATESGLHDYDHLLPDDSPARLRERAAWLRDLDQRLVASVPWQDLPVEARVDYALLRSRLATLRAEIEEMRVPNRMPSLYLERAYLALYLPYARASAPPDERKEAVVARLFALPDYLAGAQANLERVPSEALDVALTLAARGPSVVEEVVRGLVRRFPGEAEKIEHAGARARAGILRYHDHLVRTLVPEPAGGFAISARWFDYRMEHEHLLGLRAADVEELAAEEVARARRRLEDEAARAGSARSWREWLEEGRKRHVETAWLREAWVAEVERARRFVAERGIVTPLAQDKLEIEPVPAFLAADAPEMRYQAPAVFDRDTTGRLWVLPRDARRDEAATERLLRAHCAPELPLHVLRLAYPGRHVCRLRARTAPSRLRLLARDAAFAGGWTALAEDAMRDAGYFTADPLTPLFHAAGDVRRALLAHADAALHAGRMRPGEAAMRLVDEAGAEPARAAANVRAVMLAPTRAAAAFAGTIAMRELRDTTAAAMGTRFDARAFHDALPAGGTIPPGLVREEVGERLGAA